MNRILLWTLAVGVELPFTLPALHAAEILFPQNRSTFYSDELIEFSVAGLAEGAAATIQFVPKDARLTTPPEITVTGKDGTMTFAVPPLAFAPSDYVVKLTADGQASTAHLKVVAGVNRSTMFFSQTINWNDLAAAQANFVVGNAFSFGHLGPDGLPSTSFRGRLSSGMSAFERAMSMDLPTLVYMYWTGYVTHKPFGTHKSWAETSMVEAMRLLNFHTAQRIRRYHKNISLVGTLDEPGLAWGRTPAGGSASGFPGWDEQPWYERRGWRFTDNPAARPDDDWIKYLTIRCAIMKENNAQAKTDLHSVWPEMVFSTDLYAPQAILDGTDPLNQEVNDIPSSHVFLDWGIGRAGVISAVYLEKAHDPASKLAHAMNGQLFGKAVPQPMQTDVYRLMRNGMLAAGLHGNWWLNPTGMKPADLGAVNEPALRLGPLFREMAPVDHDTAVLWSFTEIGMREKEITAREARKQIGEQIKLLVASLPENTALKEGELNINAYNIGGNYKEQVLSAHYALIRAGYPAHIVHERLLPRGVLKHYRALVIVGQTFDLPADVQRAISDFGAAGGKVVVDRTTTIELPDALVTEANFKDPAYRWTPLFLAADQKKFKTTKEASYFQSNYFMDEMVREAVAPLKGAMQQTKARPLFVSDSIHLLGERHRGGEGELLMVLNAYEELPDIPDEEAYWLYNLAPCSTSFTFQGIRPGSTIYRIEGADWTQASLLSQAEQPQSATFAPGEMKLYLVAPRAPKGLPVKATWARGALTVTARLEDVKMPWPFTLIITSPDGAELYRVHRATGPDGQFTETFPLGSNAAPGMYRVTAESPAGDLRSETKVEFAGAVAEPREIADKVRVFDEAAIRQFLADKPQLVIAVGNDSQQPVAAKLAADLTSRGFRATVRPAAEVLRKKAYPRVWNPYAKVYSPTAEEKKPEAMEVKEHIELGYRPDGSLAGQWAVPNSLVTIVGDGYVDYSGDQEQCFEAGVQLYFDDQRAMTVIKGEPKDLPATAELRAKWGQPWTRLTSYVGGYQLPPQLPEAYTTDVHLILLGDSNASFAVAALQASDLLPRIVDEKYPGPGKALVQFAWSPFAVERNVIYLGATTPQGLQAGVDQLRALAAR